MKSYKILTIILLITVSSCSTYYEVNRAFNEEFEGAQFEEANKTLAKYKKPDTGKDRLLYYLNRGVVLSMLGQYEESNAYFEKAYLYTEDYQINYLNEAGSYLTNPMFADYRGEDHENLMVLYYKALNYLKLEEFDKALVECKRLNIRLNVLSDKYRSEKKYQRDAFIHTLMGIIYDAKKDYNNAFIAYRNALEIYRDDYQVMFNVQVPNQLKEDLLRTAHLTGFTQEMDLYKEEFGMPDYKYTPQEGGTLVFFWNNGLSPVKSEWSINFGVVRGKGGVVNFTNDEYNFNFPFVVPYDEETGKTGLEDLEFFRVAFPKYRERSEFFVRGELAINSRTYPLELAENINAIAFRSLKERMVKEFGQALVRVALKKAVEEGTRNEQDGLGAAIGLFNALTEKADTRNWQTLPHSIYYTRALLPGQQEVTVKLYRAGMDRGQEENFTFQVTEGQTVFQTFASLEYDYQNYP